MQNRTWACIECGKTYRRDVAVDVVSCAICGIQCEPLHTKIRVPSPNNRRKWLEFWRQYKAEQQSLSDYYAGKTNCAITLEILNLRLEEPNNQVNSLLHPKRRKSGATDISRHTTKVRKLFLEGYSPSFIARNLKVSYATVLKILENR